MRNLRRESGGFASNGMHFLALENCGYPGSAWGPEQRSSDGTGALLKSGTTSG